MTEWARPGDINNSTTGFHGRLQDRLRLWSPTTDRVLWSYIPDRGSCGGNKSQIKIQNGGRKVGPEENQVLSEICLPKQGNTTARCDFWWRNEMGRVLATEERRRPHSVGQYSKAINSACGIECRNEMEAVLEKKEIRTLSITARISTPRVAWDGRIIDNGGKKALTERWPVQQGDQQRDVAWDGEMRWKQYWQGRK
ncbi:hypothetical protein J6590_023732 [Homalodisca vitripennis]|nr:hypothetical protein J6590_023732 [Homalodisca vitripennis]